MSKRGRRKSGAQIQKAQLAALRDGHVLSKAQHIVGVGRTNSPLPSAEPDWTRRCQCGATPIVPATGLCGPCTFGEADTSGGNW